MKKIIIAALTILALTACHEREPLGTYTVERQWAGPVVSIKSCHRGKHSKFNCLVLIEGQDRYIRREFRDWPGRSIRVGDNLGTLYRVGDKYVELYKINDRFNTMNYLYRCEKADPTCVWPSKLAPKAFTP